MLATKKKVKVYDVAYDQHESLTIQANKYPIKSKDSVPKVKELLDSNQKPYVEVQLFNCTNLPSMDRNGKADPYVVFSVGERRTRSTTKLRTKNPDWKESFIMSIDELTLNSGSNIQLIAEVFDFDRFSDDDYIGRVVVYLNHGQWQDGVPQKFTSNLIGTHQGNLTVSVTRHNFEGYIIPSTESIFDEMISLSISEKKLETDVSVSESSDVESEETEKEKAPDLKSDSKDTTELPPLKKDFGPIEEKTEERADVPTSLDNERASSDKTTNSIDGHDPKNYEIPLNEVFTTEIDYELESYVDNDFPCELSSLYDPADKTAKIPDGVFKCTQWLRLSDICPYPQLFVDGANADDVVQGDLGDCWFLGSLSCVGSRQELLDRCIAVIPSTPKRGHYAFRFFKGGQWVTVHVDDRMPCDSNRTLIFGRCREVNEVWVPLMEKAYAKLHGNYQALEAGTSMEGLVDLTGGVALGRNDITPDMATSDDLWNEISFKNQAGEYMMGICVDGEHEARAEAVGLLTDHQYVILDCVETSSGERLLKMRNPWGCREWNGRWSDDSKEWTDALIKDLNVQFGDDGIFYMNYEDFCHQWSHIESVRIFSQDKSWSCQTRKGAWGLGTGGNGARNPQYILHLEADSSVYLSLMQYDARFTDDDKFENDLIALILVKYNGVYDKENPEKAEQILDLSSFQVISRTKFQSAREVTIATDLQAGTYVVVACTYVRETHTSFIIRSFVHQSQFQLTALPSFNSVYHSKVIEGEWTDKTSGGCSNTWKWVKNPQYRIRILGTTSSADLTYSQIQIGDKIRAMGAYLLQPNALDDSVAVNQMKKAGDMGQFVTTERMERVVKGIYPDTTLLLVPSMFEQKQQAKFQFELAVSKQDHPTCQIEIRKLESDWASVKSEWNRENAGGCSNSPQTWLTNPKFSVSVCETVAVNFTLCLKCEKKDATGIGLYIFSKENTIPLAQSQFENNIVLNFGHTLEKDQVYSVMPVTFQPGVFRKFKLHAWTKTGVGLSLRA